MSVTNRKNLIGENKFKNDLYYVLGEEITKKNFLCFTAYYSLQKL